MTEISSIERLKQFLEADGLLLEGGSPDACIQQFQTSNGVHIPKDLASYFSEIDGTKGNYAIGMIRFWGIGEVERLSNVIPRASVGGSATIQSSYSEPIENGNNYFFFADCQYEAQVYAIRLTQEAGGNDVIMLNGDKPKVVAKSLSEFIEFYIDHPEKIGVTMD